MIVSEAYVPRRVVFVSRDGKLTHDADVWLQSIANTVSALNTSILSGPDADPNGIVVGSPGYLYRAMGDGVTASALYVKESGVNTDTGWVLK